MKEITKITLLFLFLVMVQGCAGLGDYDIELPGKYSVVRTSAHQVTISPQQSSSSWGSPIVPAKVVQVAWNENYILAKQLGLKQDPNKTNYYEIPDETKEYYWILNVRTKEAYGPLNKQDFDNKKKELLISDTIVLKDLNKYTK